jgi:hypothetical protein
MVYLAESHASIFHYLPGKNSPEYLPFSTWLKDNTWQILVLSKLVVSSKAYHGDVHSIQHYMIKFVSDLRQVGGFLRFPPPIKLTATI